MSLLKPVTHLANLYADRGEFDRQRFSPPIDADTTGDFFRRSRRCGTSTLFPGSIDGRFEKSCDKIPQPDWLTLLEIRSDERRKPRERAHLANAGKFNRRYLTCQISAILCADRGDRRLKSPGVSSALDSAQPHSSSYTFTYVVVTLLQNGGYE